MNEPITQGWQVRLYPNREQAARLELWANHARGAWNRLLGEVVRRYEADGTFLWKKDLQKLAVAWKHEPETEWLAELPAHALLDVCARLDKALHRMLIERKAGRQCGFPRFKKKRWGEGSVYFVNQNTRFDPGGRRVRLPKLGTVKLRGGTAPTGRLMGCRAVRDGDRWLLSAQFECAASQPLPATGTRLGIDTGLRSLVTTYDGAAFESVTPPRPLRAALRRLARAQRVLARRQRHSARREAQVKRVAALYRKVRCRRHDHLHKVSHRLTAKADVLVVETLNIRAMARSLNLGRSVADVAPGSLLRFVAYKAAWRGRELIAAPAHYPSTRKCHGCGALHDMPLGKRVMSCGCGVRIDRDENAAVNLYRYPEEPGNRARQGATRGETGSAAAGASPASDPAAEPRIPTAVRNDHESQ
ncbi:MAG: RNA-guided endonuclease InsQ/TnpB family protein [Alphaproteobacteria bacterium]